MLLKIDKSSIAVILRKLITYELTNLEHLCTIQRFKLYIDIYLGLKFDMIMNC